VKIVVCSEVSDRFPYNPEKTMNQFDWKSFLAICRNTLERELGFHIQALHGALLPHLAVCHTISITGAVDSLILMNY
jgi:hypothetical protein